MPINVSGAICSATAEKITIKRNSGSYVNGLWVEPDEPVSIKALASVQQATAKQVLLLPEGERSSDTKVFFSNKPLYGSSEKSNTPSDEVLYKGNLYKIITPEDWESYGYTRAMGVRLRG